MWRSKTAVPGASAVGERPSGESKGTKARPLPLGPFIGLWLLLREMWSKQEFEQRGMWTGSG